MPLQYICSYNGFFGSERQFGRRNKRPLVSLRLRAVLVKGWTGHASRSGSWLKKQVSAPSVSSLLTYFHAPKPERHLTALRLEEKPQWKQTERNKNTSLPFLAHWHWGKNMAWEMLPLLEKSSLCFLAPSQTDRACSCVYISSGHWCICWGKQHMKLRNR